MTDPVPEDLQPDVDQLTRELQEATARADALDVRCSAAERLANAVANMPGYEPGNLAEADEFTAALELWRRVSAEHHTTRANDYGDAIQQLAEAKTWVPELDDNYRRAVAENAAHWGQTVAEWLGDSVAQYLAEYGRKGGL